MAVHETESVDDRKYGVLQKDVGLFTLANTIIIIGKSGTKKKKRNSQQVKQKNSYFITLKYTSIIFVQIAMTGFH